jgi:hypothetical protein
MNLKFCIKINFLNQQCNLFLCKLIESDGKEIVNKEEYELFKLTHIWSHSSHISHSFISIILYVKYNIFF